MIKQDPELEKDKGFTPITSVNSQINLTLSEKDQVTFSASILDSCTEHSIYALDLDLNIIAWNEGARRLFLYEPLEVIGKLSLSNLLDPSDVQSGKMQKIIDEACMNGIWSGDLKCIRKDNEPVSVLLTLSVRTNIRGKTVGYTILAYDQTELGIKLKALTDSKEYTRSLIESNMDVLMTTDSLGIINDVNQQICNLTGSSREGLIGSLFKTHFTDVMRAEDLIRKVLSDDRITNYELTIKSHNGESTPVSFNATTFRAENGRLKGIFATARNITEQKRLENQSLTQNNALIEATTLLNDVLKSSISYSIFALDLEGNILIWNEGAKRNYGYSSEEIIGKKNQRILHTPEDVESNRPEKMLLETLKVGTYDGVFDCVRKNGERFPALVSVTIRRDPEGKPVGFVRISKDITAQKQQEQALREQLSYNRSLFESSIDILMATDTLGIITDVNKQMCMVTGYTLAELIGTQFKDHFTDARRAEDCIRNVLTDERVTNYELTIKSKDGLETVISCNATTFKGTDQKLRGVFAVARDITEQKRLEEESREQNVKLKEATGFLSNVLESSTAYSIIAEDLEGNILAWNEGARLNYGYTSDEMIGKKNTSVLHAPEDIKSGRLQAVLDAALRTGKEEGVLESVRKNGERFTASLALTLRKDANGHPVGYLLISKDITSQKREEVLISKNVELEEKNRLTQEANRLKSEFLANMSHELRSPLNGIIGFTELMHTGKVGPVSTEHKEYLGDILTSSRHLLRLINDILDLAKVESGKMEFHPQTIDLGTIVVEVCDIMRTLLSKKRIQLSVDIDPSIGKVVIDPAKLKQILYNYISNSIKFTNEEGSVVIRILPSGSEFFRVEIEDTGIGIREADLPKLFSEFTQLDASLDKKYQGTGLGLALTRRIAEAQGGHVGVKSTFEQGSTFFAVLPRVPLSDDQKSTASNAPTTEVINVEKVEKIIKVDKSIDVVNGLSNVLVIDDNPADNALITNALNGAGYRTQASFKGHDALELCSKQSFDLITLDLLLPDTNGWDILRTIRSKGPNLSTPVIVVTVVGSKAASFGFMIQNFLIKPTSSEDLILALEQTGVLKDNKKTILFVDDEQSILTLYKAYLKDYDATILCETDPENALKLAELHTPDVVVLDLLMPNIDGLEFLRRFRLTESGKKTPVIISTSQDVTDVDRSRIQASVAAVIQKGGGSMEKLINEVKRICPTMDDGGK